MYFEEKTHIMYNLVNGENDLTLLFIHGLGENSRTWEKVKGNLTISNSTLFIDLPGHGQSPLKKRSNYSHASLAKLLWKFNDEIGTNHLVIVGHSLGGNIALRMAAIRPEKVKGLFLLSPSMFNLRIFPFPRLITNNIFIRPLLNVIIKKNLRSPESIIRILKKAVFDEMVIDDHVIERIVTPLADNPKSYLTLIYLFRDSFRNHKLPNFRQIEIPVLAINGEEDPWVKPEDTRRLANLLPESELIVLPFCGHLPQEEKAEEVTRLLEKFVTNLKQK